MAISNILKDIRIERNLIQEDLAEATAPVAVPSAELNVGSETPRWKWQSDLPII